MCALEDVRTRSFAGFGCESLCQRSTALGFQMGTGIYPWVGTLVMGSLMGRRFKLGRTWMFIRNGSTVFYLTCFRVCARKFMYLLVA
jgi:hypothetical protein